MYIHFAFSTLGKQGKIQEQTEEIIDKILIPKILKSFKCTEHLPVFPIPGVIHGYAGGPNVAKVFNPQTNTWGISISIRPSDLWHGPLTYRSDDIPMICFIQLKFDELAKSPHPHQYGKFGIVLKDELLEKKRVSPVTYYTEETIWTDPEIVEWNRIEKEKYEKTKAYNIRHNIVKEFHELDARQTQLYFEILRFKKPAMLFQSINRKITAEISNSGVKFLKYDRYPQGYDFTKENEYRLAFDKDSEVLNFEETDVHMIITPDQLSKQQVEEFLNHSWSHQPSVTVYPE